MLETWGRSGVRRTGSEEVRRRRDGVRRRNRIPQPRHPRSPLEVCHENGDGSSQVRALTGVDVVRGFDGWSFFDRLPSTVFAHRSGVQETHCS